MKINEAQDIIRKYGKIMGLVSSDTMFFCFPAGVYPKSLLSISKKTILEALNFC